MQSFGHRGSPLLAARARWAWALAGACGALIPALWTWGFTVDDALISVRYARHIASGLGWRFNVGGPSTDGVTPLPWALILAPLARSEDALGVLERAKLLGLISWVFASTLLGVAIGAERAAPVWARAAVLVTMALSVPLAAYAVSGMETAVATSLATCAAIACRRPLVAAIFAGLSASLRPEMAPWACALALGLSMTGDRSLTRSALAVGAALAPFIVCCVIRWVAWSRPAPLAVLAKPSDFSHGAAYAVAGLVVSVVPILVIAPRSLVRTPRAAALVAAALIHALAVAVAGGDWMPYARLLVPVLPSVAYAGALIARHGHRAATAARSLVALGLGAVFLVRSGGEGRHVGADRAMLVEAARPWLQPLARVAALDVGWVGAATEADIVDLAGVTDPVIAAMPGGHTSKRIGSMFLLGRDPDALLLYAASGPPHGQLAEWREADFPRTVEERLVHDEVVSRHFSVAAWLPLGTRGAGYVLLLRSAPSGSLYLRGPRSRSRPPPPLRDGGPPASRACWIRCLARSPSSPSGNGRSSRRVRRILPSRSTEMTFTSTASPSFISSLTFSTRWCAISET
jgi:hypothetical protein